MLLPAFIEGGVHCRVCLAPINVALGLVKYKNTECERGKPRERDDMSENHQVYVFKKKKSEHK